jgi:4-hydroxybenzoate polyprenyltransferase
MRLDRPVGIYLLYWPCVWGLMAGQIINPISYILLLKFLILFGIGAIVMRGAGCVINDLWDRDFDKAVERTKLRPLASGQITSRNAFIFLGFLCTVGLIILLQLPPLAIGLGVLSLIPVCLYPLAKRVTWYPQFILGLTFNFGVLMGGATIITQMTTTNFIPIIILYLAAIFWTVGYDTVYAHQDIEDDQQIGVKSTAQKFGRHSHTVILGCYIVMNILMATSALMMSISSPLFWILLAVTYLWMITRHYGWDHNNQQDCLRQFKSHVMVGAGIGLCLLIAAILSS